MFCVLGCRTGCHYVKNDTPHALNDLFKFSIDDDDDYEHFGPESGNADMQQFGFDFLYAQIKMLMILINMSLLFKTTQIIKAS